MRNMWQRGERAGARGFTLIEVLIALAIVAIALGAVLRAIGALSTNVEMARSRLLAIWSADNVLSEISIGQQWPDPGQSTFSCPQGRYRFVCRQTVTQLSSPLIRQVEVRVYGYAASADVLADAATVIQNEIRR
ncbi:MULTISPECIES: type II secretion system minor pseudopilin GspI [Paraburkholderia]|jgi:general secretion pathway protein I|uniref:Type II secretion system protein I n=1 Tax=Paraburkholderia phenazinium TaxID=60549 RepID=A0A1N6GPS8_9BURK|nr:type II secretion system minor pseudopilin GspI [Paraburkholderia phenazinium]SIO09551.1 general secretion pathway protein I [Paraburkholderia phenazinium]